jgi:hypothetical protein
MVTCLMVVAILTLAIFLPIWGLPRQLQLCGEPLNNHWIISNLLYKYLWLVFAGVYFADFKSRKFVHECFLDAEHITCVRARNPC